MAVNRRRFLVGLAAAPVVSNGAQAQSAPDSNSAAMPIVHHGDAFYDYIYTLTRADGTVMQLGKDFKTFNVEMRPKARKRVR